MCRTKEEQEWIKEGFEYAKKNIKSVYDLAEPVPFTEFDYFNKFGEKKGPLYYEGILKFKKELFKNSPDFSLLYSLSIDEREELKRLLYEYCLPYSLLTCNFLERKIPMLTRRLAREEHKRHWDYFFNYSNVIDMHCDFKKRVAMHKKFRQKELKLSAENIVGMLAKIIKQRRIK